jgi:uncharacterized membrane protein
MICIYTLNALALSQTFGLEHVKQFLTYILSGADTPIILNHYVRLVVHLLKAINGLESILHHHNTLFSLYQPWNKAASSFK